MNKHGYQPMTVLMQSESSGFGWALTPGRSSPTAIALKILIALSAVIPLGVIGLASFTAAGSKQPIPTIGKPNTPAPVSKTDELVAVPDSETNRTDSTPVAENSQAAVQETKEPAAPSPSYATSEKPEVIANNSESTQSAPRAVQRIKLEKFRRRVERQRARLEELSQKHAISAEAYRQGEQKYKEDIARYRSELNSVITVIK
jgi:hypothetical protein